MSISILRTKMYNFMMNLTVGMFTIFIPGDLYESNEQEEAEYSSHRSGHRC